MSYKLGWYQLSTKILTFFKASIVKNKAVTVNYEYPKLLNQQLKYSSILIAKPKQNLLFFGSKIIVARLAYLI